MHVVGPAIPNAYVNFTTVKLNTSLWKLGLLSLVHLPRPPQTRQEAESVVIAKPYNPVLSLILNLIDMNTTGSARRQASVQHVLVARIDQIQLWFVSQPDNEQPFRKWKYVDRSGHPFLYLAETTPLSADIVHIFMDPAMNAIAIAMQHRAPQACQSCRKLKRKCVLNPTLGICNRCSETGRPCVYAEVNPTAPHDDSVAVVHHNASTVPTNADASGHLDASLQQGNLLYLDTFNTGGWFDEYGQPNVHPVDMGPGGGDMTAYPSTHPGGQN